MSQADVVHLAIETMLTTFKLVAPILGVSLAVGLIISMFQSVTQIQEFTLTFVPKLAAVSLVLLFTGHWMMDTLITYVDTLFNQIPQLLGG
jgi:flagellar biosynthetic protein FliQ